ncbi:MAG: hypothetical protein NVSMB18_35510 [Acetobacteraceae bacterium]
MSNAMLPGGTAARVEMLRTVARTADSDLKLSGNTAGGAYTRMLVVPEYFFTSAGGGLLGRGDKHKIYRQLEDISAEVPELILIAGSIAYEKGVFSTDTYNVCPILWGGQIRAKLYKSNDDGVYQINGTFRTKTDAGKATPLVTLPSGITLGLDICADYNNNRLGTYLQAHALPPPDIHVQISGSNIVQTPAALARVNGVYLYCDLGSKAANGASAWRVTAQSAALGATVVRIQPDRTDMTVAGRVMFFTTPV